MSYSRIWAIDLGYSAIKGVLMAPAGDGVEILHAGILPLPPPGQHRDPARDSRLWKGVAEFGRRYHVSRHVAVVAVPAANTLVREIEVTLVGRRSLEELVQYEASNAIPYVLDEVIWDYHIFGESRRPGEHLKGVIFAARKSAIHAYLHNLSRAGIDRVADIVLAPMGLLGLLQLQRPEDTSCLAIDIGAKSSSMVGLDGDIFWMRDFDMGGADITKILMQKFEIDFKKAEETKKNISGSPLAKEMAKIISPGINAFTRELTTNLEYIGRTGHRTDFDRVFFAGGGRRLPGIREQAGRISGGKPMGIKGFKNIHLPRRTNRRMIQANMDRLAVATGAGVKALDRSMLTCSLIPETTARSTRTSGRKKFALAYAVLTVAAMALVFFFCRSAGSILMDGVEAAREANRLFADNLRKLNEAEDREWIESEIKWMLSLPEGRAQAAEIAADICAAFALANEKDALNGRFVLQSLEVLRGKTADDAVFTTQIRGRIEEGTSPVSEGEALAALNVSLIERLKSSPALAWKTGTVSFAGENGEIEAVFSRGSELRSGDELLLEIDGNWYGVQESDGTVQIIPAPPNENEEVSESGFIVPRCRMIRWNHVERTFFIEVSTPAAGTAAQRR